MFSLSSAAVSRTQIFAVAALFLVVGFLVYGASLQNGFVRWDDGMLIYQNPAVMEMSFASLKRAFTTYDPELYIPLTILSYQVDYLLGGGSPVPFHVVNLLLHIGNALLVSWFALLILRHRTVALVLGLLFLLHPLHTEAVAWASARKDVLATFWFLLSLIAWMTYQESGRRKVYMLSLLFFLLALLSKIVAATLPVVLLLLLFREGKPGKRQIADAVPFFLLSVLFGIIALFGKTAVTASSTFMEKILMAGKSTVFALQKFIMPRDLSVLYPYNDAISIGSPDFYVPLILLALVAAVVLWSLRRTRAVLLWSLFFFVTLAPTFLNFAKGDGDFYISSDRYVYIPSIGLLMLLGTLLLFLMRVRDSEQKALQRERVMAVVFGVLLLAAASASHAGSLVWRDTETLFTHVLEHAPAASYIAHNNLGNALRLKGNIAEAAEHYASSLALKPHARTYSNLGATERLLKHYPEALAAYDKALALDPGSSLAHFGRGIVYAEQGRYGEAMAAYERALIADPDSAEVYTNVGVLAMRQGRAEQAITSYRLAIAKDPFFPDAYYNLAVALTQLKQYEEAIEAYTQALLLSPRQISARINLAILELHEGKRAEAVEQFRTILRMDPGNAAAQSALSQLGAS